MHTCSCVSVSAFCRNASPYCTLWVCVCSCVCPVFINILAPSVFHQNVCFRPSKARDRGRKGKRGRKRERPCCIPISLVHWGRTVPKILGAEALSASPSHFQFTVTTVPCNSNNNNKWAKTGGICRLQQAELFKTSHDTECLKEQFQPGFYLRKIDIQSVTWMQFLSFISLCLGTHTKVVFTLVCLWWKMTLSTALVSLVST